MPGVSCKAVATQNSSEWPCSMGPILPWLRLVGVRTSYLYFSTISWTPWVLDPITNPFLGPSSWLHPASVRGLEFRGKVNQTESCSTLSLMPWVADSSCVLGGGRLPLEHNGSDTILIAWVLLRHKGGTAYGLLESAQVIPSVPENGGFLHSLITKLITWT